ncbi:MAG TPA: glycosyltransferase family 87 protein, partial [Acidimicrobiales bacterium]|nr:glycosyltransferase family 87 protein [Acidimicrobiales bacterium]
MVRRAGRAELGLVLLVAALAVLFWDLLGPFDLQTFLRAGHQVLQGRSPYVTSTDPVFRAGHAFVYPAFVAWAFAPLAVLPGSLAIDLYAAASVAAIVLAARWFGRPGLAPAALVLVSSTTVIAVQMGTVNPLLLFGLAAAWRLRDDHRVWSGVILGTVAAVKLFLSPLLIWPLLRRRYPAAVAATGTFAAALGSESLLGHISGAGYFGLLSHLQSSEAVRSWSLSSFLQSTGLAATPAGDVVIGLCAVALLGLRSARR